MSTRTVSVGACALALALLGSAHSRASSINLVGDLGPNTWTGAVFSPISTTTTTPFSQIVPGFGDVAGDVIATNTGGTAFSLVVTNLTFNALVPGPSAGMMDVGFIIRHDFQPLVVPGLYTSSHQLNGSWTTATGNVVQLESYHDVGGSNIALPGLFELNTAANPTFNLGPGTAVVPSGLPVYSVEMHLRMRIDGIGFINLPTSADVFVTLIPAPTTLLPMALAGLLAARRRRA